MASHLAEGKVLKAKVLGLKVRPKLAASTPSPCTYLIPPTGLPLAHSYPPRLASLKFLEHDSWSHLWAFAQIVPPT